MLSREECLKIMNLDHDANEYEIETRYTTLMKRYRGNNDPEAIAQLDQITLAYSILTGRYVEPEPIDPRMEEVVFGKKKREWQNIWHYGRMPLLGISLVLVFVFYLVYSIATNVPADFQVVVAGLFGSTENYEDRFEAYIGEVDTELERLELQLLPLDMRDPDDLRDPETGMIENYNADIQYAYVMKMMTLMAAESIDLYICDELVFENYSIQGAFMPLDDFYASLQDLPDEIMDHVVAHRRPFDPDESAPDDIFATPTPAPPPEEFNRDESLRIYGLEVTGLDLVEGLGLYSERQFLAIGHRSEDPERIYQFIRQWLIDHERMSEQRADYEASILESAGA